MDKIDLKKIQSFGGLEFLAKQVVEGFITGLHKSPLHGFSVEFAEHKLYNKGQSTRHIDWKLFARTEKLFVKQFEEETNLRCQIVIDNSSSMYFPAEEDSEKYSKIGFSIYCAAAIISLLRKQRDAVGLSIFDESVKIHTPAKSSSVHHKFLYSTLEKLLLDETKKSTQVIDALHQIAENIHKRSLVIIFSDMFDNATPETEKLFSALQHLKHNKHEVVLFHVIDKDKELDFKFENRPYTFIDLETQTEVKTHPSEVKEVYLKTIQKYKAAIQLKCAQYGIDFIDADISKGFDPVLRSYLIKRSRLY